MTTKETNTGTTVADLINAVTVARQAEQQAEVNYESAEEEVMRTRVKLTAARAKHADAKVALGKAKLTEAIALIDKVHGEAPKGSAAAKDIEGLLERIMQRRMTATLSDIIYVSPYAIGRMSASNPNLQQVPKAGAETTAAVKAETPVSGGGHQAKPTAPYIPKVGDKVRFIEPWWAGATPFIGKDLTVSKVSSGRYVYFKEMDHTGANTRVDNVVPAPTPTAEQCQYPFCNCTTQQVNECKKA